jgi:hypothetical protein
MRRRRQRLLEDGRCVDCGGEPKLGRTRCQKCLDVGAVASRRWQATERGKAYKRATAAKSRRALRAAGFCVYCGSRPIAERSFNGCDECLERRRKMQREARLRERESGRA